MTEPSLGELERRMIDLAGSVQRIADQLPNTYATREAMEAQARLHAAEITNLKQDIAELRKANDDRAGSMRQIVAGLVVAFVMLLIPLIGQIQNIVGGAQ